MASLASDDDDDVKQWNEHRYKMPGSPGVEVLALNAIILHFKSKPAADAYVHVI